MAVYLTLHRWGELKATDMDVAIALFGEFAVTGADRPAQVRGLIPQAIIARLALHPGEWVPADELISELWHIPPPTALSSMRAHISRLRSRGWQNILEGGTSGYRVNLTTDLVDICRYQRLVDPEARALTTIGERQSALVAAEALWSAPPLMTFTEFPFAPRALQRLRSLRRAATLELGEQRMTRGEHAIVAATVAEIVALHRDDEELVLLLARALARSGRTSDALEVLDEHASDRRGRGTLAGAAVEKLRIAIVRQDPIVISGVSRHESIVERVGIPIPLTRFIGRRAELDSIRHGRADSRLVTLTGPAGVGKTRLAVEVARRAGPEEDESQRLIDLATVAAPDRVLAAVADSVGAGAHTLDGIAKVLGGRRTLLIIDNAEHVLGAAAALCAGLLERCAGLSILVTSREAMRMAGERVVMIEPLLGDTRGDAVDLFVQRAIESSGIESWDDAHLAVIRDLCARLDGLPLAIELAASRLDMLSLAELAESLYTPDVTGPGRIDGARHGTIDDAIGWSVRLVSDAERELLAQLVCFAGSFTLDAVLGICRSGTGDPRDLAIALARKSLLSPVVLDSGERRFRVLEAVKRHMRSGHPLVETDAWLRRHADWMTAFAEAQEPRLRTAEARSAKAALAATRADLDDALAWLIERQDRATSMRLVAALAWYWYERGQGVDAIDRVDRVIALPGPSMPDAEANALRACTFMRSVGADPLETARYGRRQAEAADAAEDPLHPMLAHVMLGYLAALEDMAEEANEELAHAAEARESVAAESAWARADELLIRGDVLRLLGHPAQALEALSEAFRLATDIDHVWAIKASSFVAGKVLVQVRRPQDAIGILRTGAVRSLETEDPTSALAAVNVIAAAYVALDDAPRAAELFGAVEALGARFNFHAGGSDAAYTDRARRAARDAMTPQDWDAALSRGRSRDLRWVMRSIGGTD